MLKTHSTVQLSSASRAKPPNELNDRPKFNVVIIYEDRAAGRRAKLFYDNLIHDLEDECDFCLDLWNFQVLAISATWDSAVQAAGQADFVILSLHGKAGLPVEIRELIETWSRLIADSNAGLIALVDKPQTRGGSAASARITRTPRLSAESNLASAICRIWGRDNGWPYVIFAVVVFRVLNGTPSQ